MKAVITTSLILLLLGAVALIGLVYSGSINVAAVEEESGFTQWLLHTTYKHSVASHAADIEAPDNLYSDSMINRGAQNYQALCTGCHTAPGEQPTVQSLGLNPHPPDLNQLSNELTPSEVFWVTKNGVKMTGMPAFGPTHDDQELWALVAFLERMHNAPASEFEQVIDHATQQAPANDGHNHRHGIQPAAAHGDANHPDDHHDDGSTIPGEQSQADDGHNHQHANQAANRVANEEKQQEQTNDGHDHRDD